MAKFKPKTSGEFKVRPGRRVIWLSRPSTLSLRIGLTAVIIVGFGLIALGVPVVPMVWYRIKPSTVTALAKSLSKPVATKSQNNNRAPDVWEPRYDSTLPEGNWVGTEKIGLKTLIREASMDDYESALKQGVWRVPDFGTPSNRKLPLILAAHRFGYLKWSDAFRRQNSFFNLPKLKEGDRVYVVWEKHKYVYEIYASGQGKEIADYEADLILYTCQYLESPYRIFKYAKLVRE